jgi:serine/threonine protein kinase
VAVKQLQLVMAEWPDVRREFLREIQFMRTVRHPNIVMFIGAGHYDENHLFLVLEFMSGGALRFAIVVWEIITRKTPFTGPDYPFDSDVQEAVLNGVRPTISDTISKKLKKIINLCWKGQPKDRPTFKDVILQLKCLRKTLNPQLQTTAPKRYPKKVASIHFHELLKSEGIKKPNDKQEDLTDPSAAISVQLHHLLNPEDAEEPNMKQEELIEL